MHICQDEIVTFGWVVDHLRWGWTYAAHAWHWMRRHHRPAHEDGCCSDGSHG